MKKNVWIFTRGGFSTCTVLSDDEYAKITVEQWTELHKIRVICRMATLLPWRDFLLAAHNIDAGTIVAESAEELTDSNPMPKAKAAAA